MTMMRALMQAGGVTPEGDLEEVVLIHYTGPGAVTVYTTNLQEVIEENKALQDLLLSPQDIIFVPRKGISQANLFVEQYITNMLPFSRNVSYNYNKNRNNDTNGNYNPTPY
jgi:protein involved in polysaccharide export with SLBB domain